MKNNKLLLLSISTLLVSNSVFAASFSPISPREYYTKLGKETDATSLLDFFEIYQDELNGCVDPDVFYNATLDLAKLGYDENYRETIVKIQQCPNIDAALADAIKTRLQDFDKEQATQNTVILAAAIEEKTDISTAPVANKQNLFTEDENTTTIVQPQAVSSSKTRRQKKFETEVPERSPRLLKVEPIRISRCALPVVKTAPISIASAPKDKYVFKIKESTRNKNGDKGTSKLFSEKTTVSLVGDNIEFGFSREHLSAGKLKTGEFFGSYYNYSATGHAGYGQAQKQDVFTPYFKYQNQSLSLALGTTPLKAQIDAAPTFDIGYKFLNNFTLSAYNRGLEDSVLSKVGMKDIYSGKEWGRVLESGGKLAYDTTFGEEYFLNTDISYNFYSGKNVHSNYSLKYHLSVGKYHNGLSYGLYNTLEHYKENQDNQTFGHGGYYSPQLLAGVYPFISYKIENETQKFSVDMSTGVYYEKKDMVPTYLKDCPAYLRHSSYEAESGWNVAYNIGLEYEKDLGNNFKLFAGGRYMGATSDYNEWLFNFGIGKSF